MAPHLLLRTRSAREGGEACPKTDESGEKGFHGAKEGRDPDHAPVHAKAHSNPDCGVRKDEQAFGRKDEEAVRRKKACGEKGRPGIQDQEEIARFPLRSYP